MSTDVIEDKETWHHCEIIVRDEGGIMQNSWPTEMYAGCPPVMRMIFSILFGLDE